MEIKLSNLTIYCAWCSWIRENNDSDYHAMCQGNVCDCKCRTYTKRQPYAEYHVTGPTFTLADKCLNSERCN